MQVGQDVLSVNSGAALNEKRSKGRAGSDAAQGRPRKVEYLGKQVSKGPALIVVITTRSSSL